MVTVTRAQPAERAVRGLAGKPGFAALAKSKVYLKVAGKDAEKAFFLAPLAEVTSLWKRGDYDSWKDAVQDARNLALDARRFGKSHAAAARQAPGRRPGARREGDGERSDLEARPEGAAVAHPDRPPAHRQRGASEPG